MSASELLTPIQVAPVATVVVMAVAFVMSLITSSTNRLIIGHFVGWDNYRSMQKELSDFRKESMAAARSNDKKQLEKVKKRQPQINAINAKLMKPQMIQMALVFCYFPVWMFVLTLTFTVNGAPLNVAIIPGIGPVPMWIWYFMASTFFGTLLMRIIGTLPIEQ
ncbi:MAG: EMC3/TMCO1 family protein [Nitrososphaerota archaeon]|nr:EMC3/TMCO1 family protein [Nitrososphaerota archaeon]